MENWVLVDTCIWAAFFGKPGSPEKAAVDDLLDGDRVALVGPIVAEVLQGFRRKVEIVVDQHVIVQAVILDFPGRIRQPAPNHLVAILTPRPKTLFQDHTRRRKHKNSDSVGNPLL